MVFRFQVKVQRIYTTIPDLSWGPTNGGVTNGGLIRGVWPPFLEIGQNRPFSPFFCLFRPFPEGAKSTWKIQKTEEKGLFPQISSDLLKPPSLKPPFAALQLSLLAGVLRVGWRFGVGSSEEPLCSPEMEAAWTMPTWKELQWIRNMQPPRLAQAC